MLSAVSNPALPEWRRSRYTTVEPSVVDTNEPSRIARCPYLGGYVCIELMGLFQCRQWKDLNSGVFINRKFHCNSFLLTSSKDEHNFVFKVLWVNWHRLVSLWTGGFRWGTDRDKEGTNHIYLCQFHPLYVCRDVGYPHTSAGGQR